MNENQSDNLSIISQKEYDECYSKLLSVGIPGPTAKDMALLAVKFLHDEEFRTVYKEAVDRGDYTKCLKMLSDLKDHVMIERTNHHSIFFRIWNKFKELFS